MSYFPPPPPPPPQAPGNVADTARCAPRGGYRGSPIRGSRGRAGSFQNRRGNYRHGSAPTLASGGDLSTATTGFYGGHLGRAPSNQGADVSASKSNKGGFRPPQAGWANTNGSQSVQGTLNANTPHANRRSSPHYASKDLQTDHAESQIVHANAPAHSPGQKRVYSDAFGSKSSPIPRGHAPPPVPSFGAPLPIPVKAPAPQGNQARNRDLRLGHNILGLTPQIEKDDVSSHDDEGGENEEAKLMSQSASNTGQQG